MGQSEGRPKRQHESQLYGNGCRSGGRALPNRCCNQRCSAQKLKIQEPCLLANPLNPNSTRLFAVTLRAGLGPPSVASLSSCWPAALQEPACGARASSSCDCKAHLFAQQCPKGILLSQPYFPSPERPFRAGCFCLQIQGRCFEEQDGDGICVRATACCVSSGQGRLVCLTARSLAGLKKLQTLDIGSFCLLVLRGPQVGKGPTIFPSRRAPFVCILEGTVFQINGIHPHIDSKMHAVNCAPFSSSGKLRCYTQGPSNSNHL